MKRYVWKLDATSAVVKEPGGFGETYRASTERPYAVRVSCVRVAEDENRVYGGRYLLKTSGAVRTFGSVAAARRAYVSWKSAENIRAILDVRFQGTTPAGPFEEPPAGHMVGA